MSSFCKFNVKNDARLKEYSYLCSRYFILHNSQTKVDMYFTGIIIAVSTFLIIGLFHPIVIKAEYYFGVRSWWAFLVVGLICVGAALFIENDIISSLVGVFGASSLWGIGELFAQKKRVEKGWFPKNPNRVYD